MYMSPSRLKDLGNIAHKRKDELYNELHKIFGYINLDSPQQMKDGFLKRGIELESTASWAFTDKRGTPEVDMFLEYKKYAKLVSAFIDKLPAHLNYATHRIHANYNQCWTTTGRFSCSDPNLQQLPADKAVRACFMAEPGNKLVIADYSQIELRVAAEIARDQRMVSAYRNSEDLHTLTASLITGKPREEVTKQDRQKAKAANFGLLYGQGPPGFQKYAKNNYGVEMSLEEATEFREHFFKAYAGLKRWHFETGRKQDSTREVRTLLNRRRLLVPGEAKYTELLNTPIQGTAADITKLALIKLNQLLPSKAKIVGCVHDEILVESPESDADFVKECVQTAMESAGSEILHHVPVVADAKICDDWSEK
jgi:DNA polymerase I-like protein with 3'-5' exonuclease and polymerase domains